MTKVDILPPVESREPAKWSGRFVFGDAWAAYNGPVAHNTLHEHAAIQLACSSEAIVTIIDFDGNKFSGSALLIRPLVSHAVSCTGSVLMFYFEPQSPLAFALLDLVGSEDVEPIPDEVLHLIDLSQTPDHWIERLTPIERSAARELDTRLSFALSALAEAPGQLSIAEAGERCGLSESRLRTLAREQLGLPLSTWLIWRKLERAARELSCGASLADAAFAGGFADQAHFARAIRRMFGVTPKMAKDTLAHR